MTESQGESRNAQSQSSDLVIQRGTILVYRVFDIAEEINLPRVEEILRDRQGGLRLSLPRGGRNAIVMRNPPIRLHLGQTGFRIQNRIVQAETLGTIWDYGVLSIVFQIPIPPGTRWNELISDGAVLNGDVTGAEEIDIAAQNRANEVKSLLHSALTHPSQWTVFEDYSIYFFEEIQGVTRASQLLEQGKLPELILGEAKEKLSEKSRHAILETTHQYAENDLVAVDWNSAIVLEPSGNRDIPDVIEFALTHLLEFRYYDDLLDRRLASLYDSIEAHRGGIWKSRFAQLSKEANARYIELSEFLERIDNSLKFVGDLYLAVIYRTAIRRFRMADWQQSITRKMNLLSRVAEILQGEINVYRGHTLEFIIIVLIFFEIVSAMLKLF